jgi:peptidoglycan L-alanyl-D-glutamate endopeptidase CwlK
MAQVVARKFLAAVIDAGIDAKITSGNRSWAEQDALFARRPQVTKARGGFSNHNFGIAWDIGIFKSGAYLPESPFYARAGAIGRKQGLEWGGDWRSFKDEPHCNLKTGLTMAQLRSAFLKGEAYV